MIQNITAQLVSIVIHQFVVVMEHVFPQELDMLAHAALDGLEQLVICVTLDTMVQHVNFVMRQHVGSMGRVLLLVVVMHVLVALDGLGLPVTNVILIILEPIANFVMVEQHAQTMDPVLAPVQDSHARAMLLDGQERIAAHVQQIIMVQLANIAIVPFVAAMEHALDRE